MNHIIILPILLPFLVAVTLLIGYKIPNQIKRYISISMSFILIILSFSLIEKASYDEVLIYKVGNWEPPFGIILVLDRLSALMVLVVSILAFTSLLYAYKKDDRKGFNFHSIFHFQLMGINGAFLTGDMFNLFVFFEVLLIASYVLLLQENKAKQLKVATHYIVLNLVGSSMFLIALSILYGILGSLNMIHLAQLIQNMDPDNVPLVKVAGFMLLTVFGLKAAIFPFHSWLPATYSSAPNSIAALFSIMTKVGFYAILRIWTILFGENSGDLTYFGYDLLWYLSIATVLIGSFGALASQKLKSMLGYLVITSVGTILASLSANTIESVTAALVYMVHSTWIMGSLYMLAGIVVAQRGPVGNDIFAGYSLKQPKLLGFLFLLSAIAVIGLPPFSGFIAKMVILKSVSNNEFQGHLWSLVLFSSFLLLITLSRAGSHLFWRSTTFPAHSDTVQRADGICILAVGILIAASQCVVIFANSTISYMHDTAKQILSVNNYLYLVN